MKLTTSLILALFASSAYAHSTHNDESRAEARLIFASIERNQVSIREEGAYRYIQANGIPDHVTGSFPNRSNPHSISEQRYQYRVPIVPTYSGGKTDVQGQPSGIALNGIPFDPGTAECYGQPRGGRPGTSCEWREEAIINGKGQLGLDTSNAHVQPSGAYHYHGIPNGLVALRTQAGQDLVHVGYGADGHKMWVSLSGAYRPSYQLKSGTRPNGPGGRYTGQYTEDYQFISGSGDLDNCNGVTIEGEYGYVLTKQFPFIPRCLNGTPDPSFERRRSGGRDEQGGKERRGPPPFGHRPPHHRL